MEFPTIGPTKELYIDCKRAYKKAIKFHKKNANKLTPTDLKSALCNHDKINFWKTFNKNADPKVIKCKDLKSLNFAQQFKDNFISSADNTKALNDFITAFSELSEECPSLLVDVYDVKCAVKCI